VNEHASYANIIDGETHIAALLTALRASPQWPHMLVVVTYDEYGGWWDHVAPPKADRFGPGSRVPALIVSPYARMGTVDHTPYDTASILRFITARWKLPVLPGIAARDAALAANGAPELGDLTQALDLP
jgi:phospholipase C